MAVPLSRLECQIFFGFTPHPEAVGFIINQVEYFLVDKPELRGSVEIKEVDPTTNTITLNA